MNNNKYRRLIKLIFQFHPSEIVMNSPLQHKITQDQTKNCLQIVVTEIRFAIVVGKNSSNVFLTSFQIE